MNALHTNILISQLLRNSGCLATLTHIFIEICVKILYKKLCHAVLVLTSVKGSKYANSRVASPETAAIHLKG